MNIDQYRAMREAERNQADQPTAEPAATETTVEPTTTEPVVTPPETPAEPSPVEVEIDGQKVTLDELKNGYLRQSDYTRKTQEIARKRRELEEAEALYASLKANPQLAQQVGQHIPTPAGIDPVASRMRELEEKIYDMKLEADVARMQSQYKDFDVRGVLQTAHEKKLTNLEDAYRLWKATVRQEEPVDVDKLKEQIRKEMMAELNASKDTGSIITSQATPPVTENKGPRYTQAEERVATGMGLSVAEYVKWRDIQKSK